MKRLMKQLLPAEQALTEQVTRKAVLEHELGLLPDIDELRKEKKSLSDEINNLLNESRLAQTDSRIATYNDGYAKGEVARDTMTDEEFQQSKNGYSTLQSLGPKASSGSSDRVVRGRTLRPHQAIRKAISDGLGGSE